MKFAFVVLVAVCWLFDASPVAAQVRQNNLKTAENLFAVLRETTGKNKTEASLIPMGPTKVRIDGIEHEFNLAWFEYLGDMHVRFVFDGPNTMENATLEDLRLLKLQPDDALRVATKNLRRVYGAPSYKPWADGLFDVYGKSPDLDSSYFLDFDFWNGVLAKNPEGVVATVAKRGGLAFVPMSDLKAINNLRQRVSYLYKSSEHMRVSSALYLYKNGSWTVFQPAIS